MKLSGLRQSLLDESSDLEEQRADRKLDREGRNKLEALLTDAAKAENLFPAGKPGFAAALLLAVESLIAAVMGPYVLTPGGTGENLVLAAIFAALILVVFSVGPHQSLRGRKIVHGKYGSLISVAMVWSLAFIGHFWVTYALGTTITNRTLQTSAISVSGLDKGALKSTLARVGQQHLLRSDETSSKMVALYSFIGLCVSITFVSIASLHPYGFCYDPVNTFVHGLFLSGGNVLRNVLLLAIMPGMFVFFTFPGFLFTYFIFYSSTHPLFLGYSPFSFVWFLIEVNTDFLFLRTTEFFFGFVNFVLFLFFVFFYLRLVGFLRGGPSNLLSSFEPSSPGLTGAGDILARGLKFLVVSEIEESEILEVKSKEKHRSGIANLGQVGERTGPLSPRDIELEAMDLKVDDWISSHMLSIGLAIDPASVRGKSRSSRAAKNLPFIVKMARTYRREFFLKNQSTRVVKIRGDALEKQRCHLQGFSSFMFFLGFDSLEIWFWLILILDHVQQLCCIWETCDNLIFMPLFFCPAMMSDMSNLCMTSEWFQKLNDLQDRGKNAKARIHSIDKFWALRSSRWKDMAAISKRKGGFCVFWMVLVAFGG